MPIELMCGQCQGRLLAESPGSVVACPHCGTHLHVPGEAAAVASSEAPSEIVSHAAAATAAATELVTSNLESADEPPPVSPPASLVTVDQLMSLEESAASAIAAPGMIPLSELPSHSSPRMPLPEPLSPPAAFAVPAVAAAVPPPPPVAAVTPQFAPAAFSAAPAAMSYAAAGPVIVPDAPVPVETVPKFWFSLLMGYASAVTLALLFLLYLMGRVKQHSLESLPDIVPEVRRGEVEMKVALPEYDVAPGHVLRVGETRRYGSLNVTPLKVTQGTLRFEHVLNDPTAQRPPSEPVLKLWFRFENVSDGQSFSPLDSQLLFRRSYQGRGGDALTNQFLCERNERRRGGDLRYLFELSTTSEFRLAGQQLDTVLGPGQSCETFIPSQEGLDGLGGDLVWRVQFRKGYHPRTRHGVTTLIDVPFHRKDVQRDT